jgi:exoribonuclease R
MEYILETKDYKKFLLIKKIKEDYDEPTIFEDANLANGCFNGDTVSWDSNGCRLIKRGEHPILAGILELNSKIKYGITNHGNPMFLFTPYRREYPSLVVGSSERVLTHNKLALVRTEEAIPSGRTLPRGNLIELIGLTGNAKAERLALLWTYTPYKMPNSLTKLEPPIHEKRREFELRPSLPKQTFHIDPPDCRDVDDVLSIERIDSSTHRVWITISDVAEWIPVGSELDEYAKKVTATTYENGAPVRPMLPASYSEGVCSLLPGKKGLGISLAMDWNGSSLSNLMFLKTVVNVERTYTYDQADTDLSGFLDIFKKIATSLTGNQTPNSHEVIEAFMILYNREVASVLKKTGIGILRRHDSSDITKWEQFEAVRPELAFLAFKAAEYCNADDQYVYHAGLKSDAYCTASSPIRRYADLVNQRILKTLLGFSPGELTIPQIENSWLNKRQRDLKRYERDIFFITNMLHNEKRIVQGIILDWKEEENKIKCQIYIPDWKRILKWNTAGRSINSDRALCVLQQKGRLIETIIEKTMCMRFDVFWNPQTHHWKDKLVMRIA